MRRKLRYAGQELLFDTESSPLCQKDHLELLHADGVLAWVNAIVYNYKEVVAAGHSDDTALCADPEAGWGWLARRGFDIIQTDWPLMAKNYLESQNLLYR